MDRRDFFDKLYLLHYSMYKLQSLVNSYNVGTYNQELGTNIMGQNLRSRKRLC